VDIVGLTSRWLRKSPPKSRPKFPSVSPAEQNTNQSVTKHLDTQIYHVAKHDKENENTEESYWLKKKKDNHKNILAMSTPSIAVIGSLNIDFITRTPRVPGPGETLTSNSFTTGFGGKGANQAVACARLASKGTKVAMVGNVGDDNFGRDYFEALGKEGINADGVSTVKGETTGAANIVVEEETGENRIMFTPGANVAFSKEYDQGWDLVPSDAGIVVFQLEIPIDVVCFENFVSSLTGIACFLMLSPGPTQSASRSKARQAHHVQPGTRSSTA